MLAGLLVLRELVALLQLLIGTLDWGGRDLRVHLLVFVSGLVSLGGATSLALREAMGPRWHTSGVRTRLDTDPVGRGVSGVGQRARRTEFLVLAAHTGYRPATVWRVVTILAAIYVGVSMGAATHVWRRWRTRSTSPLGSTVTGGGGSVGGGASAGIGSSSTGGDWKTLFAAAAAHAPRGWQPKRWLGSLRRGPATSAASAVPSPSVTPSSTQPAAAASQLPQSGSSRGPVRRSGGGARAFPMPLAAAALASPRPASQ